MNSEAEEIFSSLFISTFLLLTWLRPCKLQKLKGSKRKLFSFCFHSRVKISYETLISFFFFFYQFPTRNMVYCKPRCEQCTMRNSLATTTHFLIPVLSLYYHTCCCCCCCCCCFVDRFYVELASFSAIWQTLCANSHVFSACLFCCCCCCCCCCCFRCLSVSIIHRNPEWTTGSLTCVCDLFAAYTHGLLSQPDGLL